MSDKPLVSILIPSYNHQNYVQDAIKSAINQTYKNIELYVIDDGSSDSTFEKIEEMRELCEKRFKNVVFEKREHTGLIPNINSFIERAQGKYILNFASDDCVKEDIVEYAVDFLEENPNYAIFAPDNEIMDSEGKIAYWDKNRNLVYDKKSAKYLTFGDFLKKEKKYIDFNSPEYGTYPTLAFGNYITNGLVIKKEVYDKIGLYNQDAPFEDWWFNLQVAKYYKIKYYDKPLFCYRWHNSNSIKNTEKMNIAYNKTIELEKNILKNIDLNSVLPSVRDFIEKGYCYKKEGLRFLFEILTYKNYDFKIKEIRLFNIPVFKFKKALN